MKACGNYLLQNAAFGKKSCKPDGIKIQPVFTTKHLKPTINWREIFDILKRSCHPHPKSQTSANRGALLTMVSCVIYSSRSESLPQFLLQIEM